MDESQSAVISPTGQSKYEIFQHSSFPEMALLKSIHPKELEDTIPCFSLEFDTCEIHCSIEFESKDGCISAILLGLYSLEEGDITIGEINIFTIPSDCNQNVNHLSEFCDETLSYRTLHVLRIDDHDNAAFHLNDDSLNVLLTIGNLEYSGFLKILFANDGLGTQLKCCAAQNMGLLDTAINIKAPNRNLVLHTIDAPKFILAARSPIFKAMLTSGMKESAQNTIDIDDFDVETVQFMLDFMYSDVFVGKRWEDCVKYLKIAHKYEVSGLIQACKTHLAANISESNMIEIWQIAEQLDLEELKYEVLSYANDGGGLENMLSAENNDDLNADLANIFIQCCGTDYILFCSNVHPFQRKRKRDESDSENEGSE